MDLNERIAARRKEIAVEEEQVRRKAERLRQMEVDAARHAAREAAQAKIDATPRPPDLMTLRAPAKKAVELDVDGQIFREAVERTTKKQLAIFCAMVVLTLIGLTKDTLMAVFWGVCAFGYIAVTISSHVDDIKNPKSKN